jgi:hypothetical protein
LQQQIRWQQQPAVWLYRRRQGRVEVRWWMKGQEAAVRKWGHWHLMHTTTITTTTTMFKV